MELDALRGVAAMAVVIFHYTTRYDELFGHKKQNYLGFEYGYLGVNLFFIISGFVIFMTLTRINSLKEFAKRRALRLYPAYIVAVVITFMAVRVYDLKGRGVSLGEAIINLTMLQGHILIPHVDGAYWSLTVELTFYLIMGLVLFLGLSNKITTISLLWLVTSGGIMIISDMSNQRLTTFVEYLAISNYSHLFIAGIMFYLIRQKGQVKHHMMILACLMYEYVFIDINSNFFVTIFFMLFYLLVNNKLNFLNMKPLVFLGTISYSFYLVHQNIGYIVINIMEKYGLINEVFLVIPVTISVGLATLLTFYVEKPIRKIFHNKSKSKRKTTSIDLTKVDYINEQ